MRDSKPAFKQVGSSEEFVAQFLSDGVWHTTLPDRMRQIEADGVIKPEPNLPDSERHSTVGGPSLYPFVRQVGGISLFDFRDFDPIEYGRVCPVSNWHCFVPTQPKAESSYWINFDPVDLGGRFRSPNWLLAEWHKVVGARPRLMPHIEAAHIGVLPLSETKHVLKATRTDYCWSVEELL